MFIGIDLGGTNISGGVIDEQGNILSKSIINTDVEKGEHYIINSINNLIVKLNNDNKYDIKGIGIGVPGTFIRDKGIVEFACNINFNNVFLAKEIRKVLDVPVYINNDSNCAALGEAYVGESKGYNSSIMITIGTGIGCGIIFNNKIYDGFNSAAGELGHMVIKKDGILCTCGRNGCFERYASASALVNQAKEFLDNTSNKSLIIELTNNRVKDINGEVIFNAARKKDKIALEIIDNYMDFLAEGLANIINILEPEVLIIGGGISQQGDYLINPLKEKTYRLIYSKTLPKTIIKAAKLGSDAGIIGAGILCIGEKDN